MYPAELTIKYKEAISFKFQQQHQRDGCVALSLPAPRWWWFHLLRSLCCSGHNTATISSLKWLWETLGASTRQGPLSVWKSYFMYKDIFGVSNRKYNFRCFTHALVLVTETFRGRLGFRHVLSHLKLHFSLSLSAPASSMYTSYTVWCLSCSKLAEMVSPTNHITQPLEYR